MAKTEKNPKTVTIYGRLSFPTFTAQEAYARSLKGNYPVASEADAPPDFQLLVEDVQFKKFTEHVENVFMPYCLAQSAAGEKRDVLSEKEIAKLLADISGDLTDQTYNTPVKPIHEKTAPLAPEAVAAIKVIGNKGVNMELKAIVNNEDEMAVPDPDQLTYPVIKPIGQTVHSMYPGCYVAATLNLYAYHNGKNPGFSAGASVAVFKADGDRFGGGATIDEDEMFLD